MFNILLGFPSKLLFVSVFFCIHCPDEKEANNKALLCFANYDLTLFWGFLYSVLRNVHYSICVNMELETNYLAKNRY